MLPPSGPDICLVSLLHGLTETEPLPIVPMDTVIDLGAGAGQRAAGPGPLPSSRAGPPVGQVTSPKGCGVLIGWLHALGERAGTVNIYREASMVTLARSGKKQERKRKFGKTIVPWYDIPVLMSVSLINGVRDGNS